MFQIRSNFFRPLHRLNYRCLLLCFLFGLSVAGNLQAQEAAPADSRETAANEATTEEVTVTEEVTERKEYATPNLWKRFQQGGWISWVLLILSVIMVSFTVERFLNLRRGNIAPNGLSDQARAAWQTGNMQQVASVAQSKPSVLGDAIELMARHPHIPANDISTMVGDEISRLMRGHLQKAYPIAIVATLSPLLGLLGTVIGMIESFEKVALVGNMGDASVLASGISMALVTTALGLIVAIPALGLYHYFRSRTHEMALAVEEEADELISDWYIAAPETPVQ